MKLSTSLLSILATSATILAQPIVLNMAREQGTHERPSLVAKGEEADDFKGLNYKSPPEISVVEARKVLSEETLDDGTDGVWNSADGKREGKRESEDVADDDFKGLNG